MESVLGGLRHVVAQHWWVMLLRGIVAILFGVIAFLWPGITLASLALLIGVSCVFDGIGAIAAGLRERFWQSTLLGVVSVLATQASCPAFVGPDLDTLAITTAQEGLENWTDASGAIFLASVGATGLPAPRWQGSTTSPFWHAEKEAHA